MKLDATASTPRPHNPQATVSGKRHHRPHKRLGGMVTQRDAEKRAPQHFVVVAIMIYRQLQLLVGAWLARRCAATDRPLAMAAAPSWRRFEGTRSLSLAPNNPG